MRRTTPRTIRPAAPLRAPDARTLYLAGELPLQVSSTGEALVVRRADGTVSRLPVTRLLRVVCCGLRVDWSGAALALCLQRQISVTWLDDDGVTQGHLWARQRQADALDAVLERLAAEETEWSQHYSHWLRQRRLAVLHAWAEQRGRARRPVAPPEWEQAKRRWVYLGEVPEVLPPCLGGMAAALVAACLQDQGLAPRYWLLDAGTLELAADLHALLWAGMNLGCGPLAQAIERPAEAAALFEHEAGVLAGSLFTHLASLRVHAQRRLDD